MTTPFVWKAADDIASAIAGVDAVAVEMENKWGVGRLELLVDDELRVKFRKQARKLNDAINAFDAERVRRHAEAMKKAWLALDLAATAAGALALDPEIWEIGLTDGRVVALTRTTAEATAATRQGRHTDVWSLDEIANVIEAFPSIVKAKQTFPGAIVKSVRAKNNEAFDWNTGDPLPF